jgi:hypothetical protein
MGTLQLVLVGTCLQANCGGQRASPHANIRRQAGSYKEEHLVFVFVGAKPASESCRSTDITSRQHSPAGRLLQGEEHFVFEFEFVGAKPASELRRSTDITSRPNSPAGRLLKGKREVYL